ncbi:Holliday junction resolvase [Candidatus Woesearchaeota archaeon]|nr:Holliday junction resolvase [Candidatus Woesearchaeota archaeon]
MSVKQKGINAERELVHKLWSNGWCAHRIAGSGSSRYPSPDIIAANGNKKIAIEVKSTKKDKRYFSEEDISQIEIFSEMFGAEAWIALRFSRKDWFFIKTGELDKTKKGFCASLELARKKGIVFDEFLRIE